MKTPVRDRPRPVKGLPEQLGGPPNGSPGTTPQVIVPPSVRLWQSIAAAHATLARALDRSDGACPVVGSDVVTVLLPLAQAPDLRLRLGELAGRSNLTPSGLTRRLDRLEVDGLVARVECAGDRRGAYSQLTEAGLRELERALPHHGTALERFVESHLDDRAIDELEELLRRLAGRATRSTTTPRD